LKPAVLALAISMMSFAMYAQGVDDLFSTPDETIADEQDESSSEEAPDEEGQDPSITDGSADGDFVDIEELLTSDGPRISGNFSFLAGGVVSLSTWETEDWIEPSNVLVVNPIASSSATLSFDVQPSSYYGFSAELATDLDSANLRYTNPEVTELYFDYTLLGAISSRVGLQPIAWGRGQVLGNSGNIISEAASSFTVKSSIPLGNANLTLVAFSNEDLLSNEGLNQAGYGFQLETAFSELAIGLNAVYRAPDPVRSGFYAKSTFASIDITNEVVADLSLNRDSGDWSIGITYTLTSFWEYVPWGLLLFVEYKTVGTIGEDWEHEAGLAALFNGIKPFGWRMGYQLIHRFNDAAGQFIPGFTREILPMVSLDIAFPISYGNELSAISSEYLPDQKSAAAVILTARIGSSFE
jgi:hypothetical protein